LCRGLRKYPDPMAGAFRRRAGELLGVPPEWILAGNGSDDILTIVTRTLVAEGQLLRLPYPSYILYRTLAELQGARSEEILFEPDWSLPESFGRDGDGLRLVFLANPNSPSGTMVPPESVLELAERLPCPLLVDEAYADFAETNCLDLVAKNERIMVSRSLSKSYALAGLRFGYIVAQPHLIEQFVKVKDSYNCDALSIAAATAALGDQAWLAETRGKILRTRERLTTAVRDLGFIVPDSQANFVWAVHSRQAVRPMYEALKRQRILVRYMSYPNWGDGLRFSVGTDSEIDTCLSAVAKLV
jgi:histidinol-phosphate aminotransferase